MVQFSKGIEKTPRSFVSDFPFPAVQQFRHEEVAISNGNFFRGRIVYLSIVAALVVIPEGRQGRLRRLHHDLLIQII